MENSRTGKRVYFLGAGASKASDFELPTMNEFFCEKDFTREGYPNLHKFTKKVFPKTDISELNLEDVITRLELSVDKFGAFGEHPEPYLYKARREFSRYVRKRLELKAKKDEEGQDRYWCKYHKDLFEHMPEQYSIITLNYDLIVDNTLFEVSPKGQANQLVSKCLLRRMYALLDGTKLKRGERPSLYHKHTQMGHYLKLHGSIDWLYCENPTCGNHQHFFPNWLDGKVTHNFPGDLCGLCGSPLVSVIIPPTMNKTFDVYPQLGLLWSLAYREIREADELVLIGMSLPDSDYYLKWLINSAISSRKDKPLKIVAVNKFEDKKKEDCYKDKIQKLTGVPPDYWNDFCKYIKHVEDIKVKQA